MRGKASSARRMAQATRCVKLIFDWPLASRCLFSSRRFSSSVRTGIVRAEVAVGICRLASMFSTMRTAPPRIGCRMSPGSTATRATAFERAPAAGAGSRVSVCSAPDLPGSRGLRGRGPGWLRCGGLGLRRPRGDGRALPGFARHADQLVEVLLPAGFHARPVLPVLLEHVEREHVVAAEVLDEGVQERVLLGGAHRESLARPVPAVPRLSPQGCAAAPATDSKLGAERDSLPRSGGGVWGVRRSTGDRQQARSGAGFTPA